MKTFSNLLVIRRIQIEITMQLPEFAKIKRKTPHLSEDGEQLEISLTLGGSINQTFWKTIWQYLIKENECLRASNSIIKNPYSCSPTTWRIFWLYYCYSLDLKYFPKAMC
jgi:hypothetical protein